MATVTKAVPRVVGKKEDMVLRFDLHQRVQHFLMMSSFLLLTFTGIPQKFHNLAISQWWVSLWGGIEQVRTLHHFGAYVMVFACLYHVGYILYTTLVLRRPFPVWMIPSPKDFRDFLLEVRYFMGLAKEKPKFGRFNYHEKFDYWAIFWGMPIMAGSGFILMFPVLVARFLPGQIIPIALVAHSDEALLAVAWIFIVHFFFAHLAPSVFPINTSIFTGKVSRKRYREDYPLDYEHIMPQEKASSQEITVSPNPQGASPLREGDTSVRMPQEAPPPSSGEISGNPPPPPLAQLKKP